MAQIITQTGDPVEEGPNEERGEETAAEILDAIGDNIRDISKGVRSWRNSLILKIGAVVVACKALDVVGKIIIENQRAKREDRDED